jgi:hypothetical protein
MTKEDIIKWAREAGFMFCEESYKHRLNCLFYGGYAVDEQLQRFAVLVEDAQAKRMHDEGMVTVGHMRQQIAAEREAVARIAEEWQGPTKDREIHISQAIRAREQE